MLETKSTKPLIQALCPTSPTATDLHAFCVQVGTVLRVPQTCHLRLRHVRDLLSPGWVQGRRRRELEEGYRGFRLVLLEPPGKALC